MWYGNKWIWQEPRLEKAIAIFVIQLIVLVFSSPASTENSLNRVIKILDGDTIEVLHDGRGVSKQIPARTFRYSFLKAYVPVSLDNPGSSTPAA
jgi:hypothetical protein